MAKNFQANVDLNVKYENASKQVSNFLNKTQLEMKTKIEKEFSKVKVKGAEKLEKILSHIGTAKMPMNVYQQFFDTMSQKAVDAGNAIANKYNKALDELAIKHNDAKRVTKGFREEANQLVEQLTSELPEASRKFQNEVVYTARKVQEETNRIGKFSKALEGFANKVKIYLSYKMINTVFQGVRELTNAAVNLETEFANIQAITSSSDETMEKLRDTILRVGEASKYSTEEIAKSTVMLGQAGLSAEEINNVLETTTQLAAATGTELSSSVDLMTSVLAVWGINSEEASHLADVMVTGMNRSKATLDTFRMAVQYAGATAANLNISFEEMAAVAAAASNAGLKASVVGTGLRAAMAELISPTKKASDGLKALGLNSSDVDIKTRGLIPVLQSLKDAGFDASSAYEILGRRAATFVLAAQGQLDKINELEIAFTEQGATLKAYNTQMETVSAQTTALGNTIKAIASDVLDSIGWMIIGFLKKMNEVLQDIRKFFGDEAKINFEETRMRLEGDLRSTSAFDKFLNRIKKGLKDDTASGEKLNKVIDAINRQFDKNIDYVGSTEKIADAWERVSGAIKSIDEDKLKQLDVEKNKRRFGIYKQAYQNQNNKFFKIDSEGMSGALKIEEYLRKHEGDASAIEDRINNFIKEGRESDAEKLKKALSVARKAIDVTKKSTSLIGMDLLEEDSGTTSGSSSLKGNKPDKTLDSATKKLEKYKAKSQILFEEYKKATGNLFDQVQEGTVTVAKADEETNGAISDMLYLKKVQDMTLADFNKMNEVDLQKLNDQIKKIKENLELTQETSKGFWDGVNDYIDKTKEQYTTAALGETVASDFADGMTNAIYSVSSGTKSMKDAFSDMTRSILEDISKMIIKMGVLKAMEAGMGWYNNNFGVTDTGGVTSSFSSTGLPGKANGGFIPKLKAAIGSKVRGGTPYRDSVPSLLMPGEYVLKKSAVDALGTNFLNDLNNNAAQTLTNTASSMMANNPWNESKEEGEPSVVNVWVVSKEEEAQMGPNDVIATISKDILTGGQTKRLIQQVVAGRK